MDNKINKQPLLKLHFDGEAIHDGRILYDDLSTFVSNISLAGPLSSFWTGKPFEQLASEQAIYPVDDASKLSGDWPEDENFDDFLKAVRSNRN